MNLESKFRLVPKDVKVEFGPKPQQTKIFIDGELTEGVTFVGVSQGANDLNPVLVLEFWIKQGQGHGRIEVPIVGKFEGKGLGGET